MIPTPNPSVLVDLLARVEVAKKADRQLDLDLWNALTNDRWEWCPPSDWLKIGLHEIVQKDHEVVFWLKREGRFEEAMNMAIAHCPTDMRLLDKLTGDINATIGFLERVLPGWWQSSGLCSLTGHASIGPDYNGPHTERLHHEWPEERFHEGFHADLKPGDGRHRQCLALIHCVLQAEIVRVR